jgi:hypothetical protein
MQYTVRVPSGFDLAKADDHVHQRLPLFENFDGLILKLYLFDPQDGLYAPVYVWRDMDAAQRFLVGDLFHGVVASFGRPRVRSWQILDFYRSDGSSASGMACREVDQVEDGESVATIVEREKALHETQIRSPGLAVRISALDPDRWEIARFSVWNSGEALPSSDADCRNTYQVLAFSALQAA